MSAIDSGAAKVEDMSDACVVAGVQNAGRASYVDALRRGPAMAWIEHERQVNESLDAVLGEQGDHWSGDIVLNEDHLW